MSVINELKNLNSLVDEAVESAQSLKRMLDINLSMSIPVSTVKNMLAIVAESNAIVAKDVAKKLKEN